jgi:hypothetical protein
MYRIVWGTGKNTDFAMRFKNSVGIVAEIFSLLAVKDI